MRRFLLLLNYFNIILGLIYILLIQLYDISIMQKVWSIQITLTLTLVLFMNGKNLIKPISFFVFSVVVFLWARPILNVFFDKPLVLAGKGMTDKNIFLSTLVLGIGISIVILSYLLSKGRSSKLISKIFIPKRFQIPENIFYIFVIGSLLFVIIFLIDSINKMNVVLSKNYLEVAGSDLLSSGINYFSIAKLLLLIWIILGKNEKRFYVASVILVVGAIGFLLIGLRGYFFSYFFLWLYFQNEKRKIRLKTLFLIGILLIFIANVILEYRLGFAVSTGFWKIVIDTLYSQGASFEVMFGSVVYRDLLLKKLPISEYFFVGGFGYCVDYVRGVNFEFGGFATSWFAEIYYFGNAFYILFCVLLGIIVAFLDKVSYLDNAKKNYAYVFLFLTIPNLVFFARSDAFDLIVKFVESLIIISFIVGIKQLKSKKQNI